MIQPRLIGPSEIRGVVTMAEAIEAVRTGFRQWGENPQINAPRRRIHIPTGVRVSVHQGGVPGMAATGLMTHCEWVKPMSDHQEYPRLNHPVIVLYDAAEGELKAIIIGEITASEPGRQPPESGPTHPARPRCAAAGCIWRPARSATARRSSSGRHRLRRPGRP